MTHKTGRDGGHGGPSQGVIRRIRVNLGGGCIRARSGAPGDGAARRGGRGRRVEQGFNSPHRSREDPLPGEPRRARGARRVRHPRRGVGRRAEDRRAGGRDRALARNRRRGDPHPPLQRHDVRGVSDVQRGVGARVRGARERRHRHEVRGRCARGHHRDGVHLPAGPPARQVGRAPHRRRGGAGLWNASRSQLRGSLCGGVVVGGGVGGGGGWPRAHGIPGFRPAPPRRVHQRRRPFPLRRHRPHAHGHRSLRRLVLCRV